MSRYACVDDQKAAGFPVTAACAAAAVSSSGFYDWQARRAAGPTARQVADAEIVELMRQIHASSDGNYGVPRMHRELRRAGLQVNHKRVRRLMRLAGLTGRFRARTVRTTIPGPDAYVIPDLVGRRFEPGPPDTAWCRYTDRLATAGLNASVGTVGDSYDNTMAEALNGTFKAELVTLHGPWRTRRELEIAIVEWIDWYNHRRLHSEIGNVPPAEHETLWYRQPDPADRTGHQ